MIKRELFHFGVKINKPFVTPVKNRWKDIFEISCKFDLIKLIRLTIKTGVVLSTYSLGRLLMKIRNKVGPRIKAFWDAHINVNSGHSR